MDAALIKPQKVRRVVRIKPTPPGDDGSVDVTARGSLVEVADPRALRPRDFRTDYVYGPQASAEDVALCDLPSMMESVLQGTDAVLLIAGPKGAGQADILDGANSLAVMAARGLLRHLQERQTRHRRPAGPEKEGGRAVLVAIRSMLNSSASKSNARALRTL